MDLVKWRNYFMLVGMDPESYEPSDSLLMNAYVHLEKHPKTQV